MPLATVKLKMNQKQNCVPKKEVLSLTTQLNIALEPEKLRSVVDSLHNETDNEAKCQEMEKIVQLIIEDEVDDETMPGLASCLSTTLGPQINQDIFPGENSSDEALTDSISTPLFVMFRNQFQLCYEENSRRKLLAKFLAELYAVQPKIGYLLLYFLKVWGQEEEKREAEPRYEFKFLKL